MKTKYYFNDIDLMELKEVYESDLSYYEIDESDEVYRNRLEHSTNEYINALEEYLYKLEVKIDDNDLKAIFYENHVPHSDNVQTMLDIRQK